MVLFFFPLISSMLPPELVRNLLGDYSLCSDSLSLVFDACLLPFCISEIGNLIVWI